MSGNNQLSLLSIVPLKVLNTLESWHWIRINIIAAQYLQNNKKLYTIMPFLGVKMPEKFCKVSLDELSHNEVWKHMLAEF